MSETQPSEVDTVAATLRTAAEWLPSRWRTMLRSEADRVNVDWNDDFCPLCDEVLCVNSCPLGHVRPPGSQPPPTGPSPQIVITAATLRIAATWLPSEHKEILQQVAVDTELRGTDDFCCPVCEEVSCDDGCPLEHVRANLPGDDL